MAHVDLFIYQLYIQVGQLEPRLPRTGSQRDEMHLPGRGVLRATGSSQHHTWHRRAEPPAPLRGTSSAPPTSHKQLPS